MKKKSKLSHIRTFGCNAYVHVPNVLRKKWDSKSEKKLFVGYERDTNNYRLLDTRTKCITISRNVIFDENPVNEAKVKGIWISIDRDIENLENDNHCEEDSVNNTDSISNSVDFEDAINSSLNENTNESIE